MTDTAKSKKPVVYRETFYVDSESITTYIDEITKKEITKFRAMAQEIGKRNDNKRIYTQIGVEDAFSVLLPKIDKRKITSQCDHPDFGNAKIKDAVAKITKAEIIDGKIWIEGEFIKNATFKDYLLPYIDAGMTLEMSVRGGSVSMACPYWDTEREAWVFGTGYRIYGWDFVTDAANPDTEVVVESLQHNIEETQPNKNHKEELIMDIKTLDELKAQYPALTDQLSNGFTSQVKTANDALEAEKSKTAEMTKQVASLTDENAKLKTVNDAVSKELAEIKLQNGIANLMKDHRYASVITIPKTIVTIEDATAHVEAETKKLDAFVATIKKPEVVVTDQQPAVPAAPAPAAPAKPNAWDSLINDAINLAKGN